MHFTMAFGSEWVDDEHDRRSHTSSVAGRVCMKLLSASPVIIAVLAVSACVNRSSPVDRPNVLILFTDDQRYNTVASARRAAHRS
jgi:hypothetical protein